jgi:aspartate aminotransferase-like enzyme
MLERARSMKQRGWYLDLLKFDDAARAHRPTQTPATPLILALAAQLDRIAASGGRTARWERHATMATMMAQWADAHPRYPLLAPPGSRSPAVSVLTMPGEVSAAKLVQAVAARGYFVATGLPPHEQTLVRIGHMGDLMPEHMEGLLAALSEAVAECDAAHSLRRNVP